MDSVSGGVDWLSEILDIRRIADETGFEVPIPVECRALASRWKALDVAERRRLDVSLREATIREARRRVVEGGVTFRFDQQVDDVLRDLGEVASFPPIILAAMPVFFTEAIDGVMKTASAFSSNVDELVSSDKERRLAETWILAAAAMSNQSLTTVVMAALAAVRCAALASGAPADAASREMFVHVLDSVLSGIARASASVNVH